MQTWRRAWAATQRLAFLVALGAALAAPASACDGSVLWVVKRETLVKSACPSTTRTLVFEYQHRGQVRTARGEVRLADLPEDHLLAVFHAITGSPVEWGRLTVLCPRTGETVHSSEPVQLEKAFCGRGFLSGLVYLDGSPPGATEKRCCPRHSKCRSRLKIIRDLLRVRD